MITKFKLGNDTYPINAISQYINLECQIIKLIMMQYVVSSTKICKPSWKFCMFLEIWQPTRRRKLCTTSLPTPPSDNRCYHQISQSVVLCSFFSSLRGERLPEIAHSPT